MMGFFSGIWAKLAAIGAAIVAFVILIGMIRKGGKDAERAAEMTEGLKRIKNANEAAAKVDPSQEAIDNDKNNLDRRP